MRIEIEIPKEFEEHFKQDKFKDSFERIIEDIKRSVKSRECSYAGRYEYETIEMLEKAFENSRQAYSVDKVVRQLNLESVGSSIQVSQGLLKAIEIVKQGGLSDDACEWLCDAYGRWHTECHVLADNEPLEYTYCPYCGKKIKAVLLNEY